MRILNFVIDVVSATTTDHFVVLNEDLHLGASLTTRTPVCKMLYVRPPVIKKIAAAEVLQVQVATVTGTSNGVSYSLVVTSYDPTTETPLRITYTITTPTTGTITATTIAAQIVAAITANPNSHVTATNAAGAITITAKTGYATFQLSNGNAGDGTGTMVFTAPSTAGVIPFGLTPYYDLLRQGLVAGQYTGSTAGYTLYTFVADKILAENNAGTYMQPSKVNIFINTDDADAAALIVAIDLVLNAATYAAIVQEFDLLP